MPERLRGVFTTRCYTNPCLYLPLPYQYITANAALTGRGQLPLPLVL